MRKSYQSPANSSPDAYAQEVARVLVVDHGMAAGQAVGLVQGSEEYIKKAHRTAVWPGYVARRIGQAAGRSRGPTPGAAMGREQTRELDGVGGGFLPEVFTAGRAGRDEGGVPRIPASQIVCVGESWQPAVFVPHDELQGNEYDPRIVAKILPDADQRLLVEGRGQILTDAKAIASERTRALRIAEKAKQWVAEHGMPTNKKSKDYLRVRNALTGPRRVERQVERPDVWRRVVEILRTHPVVASNADATAFMSGAALFAEESGNEKIESHKKEERRFTATTYASIEASCPSSCALKLSSGKDKFGRQKLGSCYAQTSNNIYPIVLLLNHVAQMLDHGPDEVAADEARAIDAGFYRGIPANHPTDLRLHTSGDTRTPAGARKLAAAALRLQRRGLWQWIQDGKGPEGALRKKLTQPLRAWSYTHAWREVRPEDWGIVSVLASIQGASEVSAAVSRGWATTIVVPPGYFAAHAEKTSDGNYRAFEIANDVKAYHDPGRPEFIDRLGRKQPARPAVSRPIQYIPCPAQHHDPKKRVGCVNCRLCFNADRLHATGMGIAFEAHGSGKKGAVTYAVGEQIVENANKRRLAVIG